MTLLGRKVWADRLSLLVVLVATAAIVDQWTSRGGELRFYILCGWSAVVALLVGYTELRIGRRQLRRGRDAMFLGLAAFVGEVHRAPTGERERVWSGTSPGALAFEPEGIRWVPKLAEDAERAIRLSWSEVYSWRIVGVLPLVWRASGYLELTLEDGRELIFHVHGVRAWRRAVREAAIMGPALGAVALVEERSPVPPAAGDSSTTPGRPLGALRPAPPVEYEAVIGLECHVELSTESKMFCSCSTRFGEAPNTQICPVCTGQPGTLPVPNRRAVEYTLRIATALNCTIAPKSVFHRKNYFYPDMPKNYQISQYDIPMATAGYLEYEVDGEMRRARIHRVHLEEDTGKIVHGSAGGRITDADHAFVDYNRAGIPLVEIVSEADLRTPEEAAAYLVELRTLLLWLGVSDVRMEEGSLRCDANVSVRPKGSDAFGTKVEIKNMNSIRSVQRALAFEIERQTGALRCGEAIVQETRHFDEASGTTIGGRAKEYSSDYRYFPDPDLPPIAPPSAWVAEIRAQVGELPFRRRRRFVTQYHLRPEDARTLVAAPELASAFEEAMRHYGGEGRPIARWYVEDIAQLARERGAEPHRSGVSPEHVAELQRLVDEGRITITLAKRDVLRAVAETGRSPRAVVEEGGLEQIADPEALARLVEEVIAEHPDLVERYRAGNPNLLNALIGPVMARTKGKANAQVVRELLTERLGAPTP